MDRATHAGVDERFFGAPAVRGTDKPWRTTEVALLREHYPKGGAAAALAVLPGRQRKAIYVKAATLGLSAPLPAHRPGAPTKYPPSEAIDAEVRRVYAENPKSADLNGLARRVMRPRGWIAKRAAALGLITPRYKPAEWTPAEVEILEGHAHQTTDYIRQLLARQGFRRTESAISTRIKRLGLDRTDPDNWTTYQLAALMGVAALTVLRWIKQEGLPAKRRGTRSRTDANIVNRGDLRRWIGSHAQLVDLRKVERYWFIDLMVNDSAADPNGRRRKASR